MSEIKIYHSISDVDKYLWDSLTENNVFMCYEWLKTLEHSSDYPTKLFYIMIFDQKKLLAATVCYYQKRIDNVPSIDSLLLGKLQKFIIMKKLSFLPALICNPKRGYGTHFIFSNELQEHEILELQNKLIDTVEKISSETKASICFYNLMNTEINLIKLLTNRGYSKTLGMPLNYIDIKWSSFEEYKKHIKKKYPLMWIQREINKNRKSGVVIKQLQNIDTNCKRLFELLKMNHNKYNNTLFPLRPNYFHQLKENFGDDAMIYASIKKDNIIGVSVLLRKGKESVLANIGIDHENSGNDCTYFNLAFYEPIKSAIESKLKRIYSGNSLYKTKAKRGFIIGDTYIFYKTHHKAVKLFIKFWFLFHSWWMNRKFSYLKDLQAFE